jgi:hypothetical protein
MTVAMLLVFVVPFWVAVGTIIEYSDNIQAWATSLKEVHLPLPPGLGRPAAARGAEDRRDVDPNTRRRHRKRWLQGLPPTLDELSVTSRPRPAA